MSATLRAAATRFEALEPNLNRLDAATGDGDHGATMVKGLRAAAEADQEPGTAFRKAAGGASGMLFAQVIDALVQIDAGAPVGPSLQKAAQRISMLGQAKAGDKTMLDALLPASTCTTLAEAAAAAQAGCAATEAMEARRGRAKYVEGAGVGHVDAGATSVAELLKLFAGGAAA